MKQDVPTLILAMLVRMDGLNSVSALNADV